MRYLPIPGFWDGFPDLDQLRAAGGEAGDLGPDDGEVAD
jgi:hypothetical protein